MSGEDEGKRYIGKVKKSLKSVEVGDKKLARDKLTEKRLKKKRQMKQRFGRDEEVEGGIAVLASGSDHDEEPQIAENEDVQSIQE